jgi:hypothetical protein
VAEVTGEPEQHLVALHEDGAQGGVVGLGQWTQDGLQVWLIPPDGRRGGHGISLG